MIRFRRLSQLLLLATICTVAATAAPSPPAALASSATAAATESVRIDPVVKVADLELQPGQTLPVEDSVIDVTFVQIIEDSRCPKNVMCYWQGRAVVELQIRHQDGTVTNELLSTLVMQGREPSTLGLAADGYQLFLVSLTPYPMAGSTAPPTDPTVLTVRVTKP